MVNNHSNCTAPQIHNDNLSLIHLDRQCSPQLDSPRHTFTIVPKVTNVETLKQEIHFLNKTLLREDHWKQFLEAWFLPPNNSPRDCFLARESTQNGGVRDVPKLKAGCCHYLFKGRGHALRALMKSIGKAKVEAKSRPRSRPMLQETKAKALQEELENPMNVHRWRELEAHQQIFMLSCPQTRY